MLDIEVIPATEKEPTATNDKEKTQATIHVSASNTSLIQDEMLALSLTCPKPV